MSEDFAEDFVIEEEEESGRAGRPFLIAAGALIGFFIILAGCLLSNVLLQQRDDSNADRVAEIESINATTEANNQLIEQTRQAVEEQQALAQEAAEATAEAIAAGDAGAAAALPATSTPEVQEAAVPDAAATAEAEAQATTEAEEAAAAADADATATAEAMAADSTGDSAGESTGTEAATGGDSATALPETGVEVWLIAAAALVMVALLFVSRRLRTIS